MEGIIGDMSMRGMRCAALAYHSYEPGSLPTTDEELCTLPQDLVLLAIIGIKVTFPALISNFKFVSMRIST